MSIEAVLNNLKPWHVEQGDALAVLRTMPDNCVNLSLCSPPYFALRDYGTGRWEGGDPECDHKTGKKWRTKAGFNERYFGKPFETDKQGADEEFFKDSCGKCGARRVDQQIGMEKLHDCQSWARGEPLCGCCYICRLVAVFAELKRVLRDDGVLTVNLSDSYSGNSVIGRRDEDRNTRNPSGYAVNANGAPMQGRVQRSDLVEGSLLGIPWRFALAMQANGWLLRSSVIWGKRAPMCESLSGWRWERHRVKQRSIGNETNGRKRTPRTYDPEIGGQRYEQPEWEPCPGCKRCEPHGGYVLRKGSWRPTRSHEHVFVFTKGGRYWCDGDAVRTPAAASTLSRDQYSRITSGKDGPYAVVHDHETPTNPLGANLRDVLTLGPESSHCACICHPAPDCPVHAGQPGPIYVDRPPPSWKRCKCDKTLHFAAFPSTLCEPFLKAYCPQRCCAECGMGWVRVVEREINGNRKVCPKDEEAFDRRFRGRDGLSSSGLHSQYLDVQTTTLGWRPACNCQSQAEPVPGVSLDPFSGTGTLLLTARRMGLRALGIELSENYSILSRCRLQADQPLFSQTTQEE